MRFVLITEQLQNYALDSFKRVAEKCYTRLNRYILARRKRFNQKVLKRLRKWQFIVHQPQHVGKHEQTC